MAKITFVTNGNRQTFVVDLATLPYQHHGLPGSLLDVALNVGVPLEHVCGGNCACTTCHVIVLAGDEHLSPMEDDEADRLDTAWEVTPRSRLACQAVVRGDVIGFIAQLFLSTDQGLVNGVLGAFGVKPVDWLGSSGRAMPVKRMKSFTAFS